jgi:hypothetical protein
MMMRALCGPFLNLQEGCRKRQRGLNLHAGWESRTRTRRPPCNRTLGTERLSRRAGFAVRSSPAERHLAADTENLVAGCCRTED